MSLVQLIRGKFARACSAKEGELASGCTSAARIWAFAALAALALHIAGLSLIFDEAEEADPESGASSIEIGVELLAPRGDPTDLPPGPDASESAPSAAAPAQKKIDEQNTLPQDTPVQTEEPDRQVSINETKEPDKEEKTKPEPNAAATAASAASEAREMPRSMVIEESSRSVAPEEGSGDNAQRVRATWERELIAHLDRYKRFAPDKLFATVEVLVSLVIDEEGHVLSASIVRGADNPAFDQAALDMIHRSDPVPKPPALVVREGLSFNLPIIFREKRANR